jgi:transcriptional regulator with XRE-family HTH domain
LLTPGQRLRLLREQCGLTIRDVESASARLAAKHGSDDYAIPLSRLSDIETKGNLPSIFRFYTLSVIYHRDYRELLSWYGVDLNRIAADLSVMQMQKSQVTEAVSSATVVRVPTKLDPAFDPRRTVNLGRFVQQWGLVPLSYLANFAQTDYTYAYVGRDDFTMYPILPPGAFLQIDESKNQVVTRVWRSEYERPIYFIEMRDGYTCAWCSLSREGLVIQPHPLSPTPEVLIKRHPQEAEVIGQVVGIAMRLGEWEPCPAEDRPPDTKEPAISN